MTGESERQLSRLEDAATKPASGGKRTPVEMGHYGIGIDKDGVWSHGGTPFPRLALAKLFATVMRRDEQGDYWLQTPVERGRIDVEDAPFLIIEMAVSGEGRAQTIRFLDNLDEWTTLDETNRLRIAEDVETETPRPYVAVRRGLEARLERPVFYELADLAIEDETGERLGVWSGGLFHDLGPVEDGGS